MYFKSYKDLAFGSWMLGDFLGEVLYACSDCPKVQAYGDMGYGDLWLNPAQLFLVAGKVVSIVCIGSDFPINFWSVSYIGHYYLWTCTLITYIDICMYIYINNYCL